MIKSLNNLNKNSLDDNNDIDMEKFRKDALETHNKFRKKYHSKDLILNDDLNQLALNYAIKLSSLGNLKHSIDKYNGIELGENLYYCKGTNINGVKMTEKWYEVNNYDFNSNKFISGTGNFTQVVWKDTKECGFGFLKAMMVLFMLSGNIILLEIIKESLLNVFILSKIYRYISIFNVFFNFFEIFILVFKILKYIYN